MISTSLCVWWNLRLRQHFQWQSWKFPIDISELISFCLMRSRWRLSHSGFKVVDWGLKMTTVFMGERHLVIKQQLELSIISRPAFNDVEHGWQPCPSLSFHDPARFSFLLSCQSLLLLEGWASATWWVRRPGWIRTGLPIIRDNEVDFRKTWTF